jgi:hypothetical protein
MIEGQFLPQTRTDDIVRGKTISLRSRFYGPLGHLNHPTLANVLAPLKSLKKSCAEHTELLPGQVARAKTLTVRVGLCASVDNLNLWLRVGNMNPFPPRPRMEARPHSRKAKTRQAAFLASA